MEELKHTSAVSAPRRMVRGARARARALSDRLRDRERLRGWIKHKIWNRLTRPHRRPGLRLHIGCGKERLDGWCNIDILPLPHVDVCLDVTQGLPFERATRVFAEHFLEHLDVLDAVRFLHDCHRCLDHDGWLRLSTPNLDWVWTHLYSREPGHDRVHRAIHINRAFYGWQHRFLWNREMLEHALVATGFEQVRWCAYGESELDDFRDIERHELNNDTPELPHVLIVEAKKGPARPEQAADLHRLLMDEFDRCRI